MAFCNGVGIRASSGGSKIKVWPCVHERTRCSTVGNINKRQHDVCLCSSKLLKVIVQGDLKGSERSMKRLLGHF